jgi:hypothetical protein
MRKTPPRNSTPDSLPVIPEMLNRNYRDLIRLNNHQIPPKNHQTNQTSKQNKVYVTVQENRVYICSLQCNNMCVYTIVKKKARICFETRPGKGKKDEKSDSESIESIKQ